MAIHTKLFEIQKSLRAMKKDTRAFGYDYLKGDTLLSFIRPKMDELGLLLLSEVEDMTLTPVAYQTYNKDAQRVIDKTEVLCDIRIRFTWVDTEDDDTLVQSWASTGMNGFDKSFGSALTYGERYYLLKLFHVQTDRDDVDAVNTDRDEAIDLAQKNPAVNARRQAAGRPAQPASGYTPVSPADYWKIIGKYCGGLKAKSGEDYRTAWINMTHADADAIKAFDADVQNYRQGQQPQQ